MIANYEEWKEKDLEKKYKMKNSTFILLAHPFFQLSLGLIIVKLFLSLKCAKTRALQIKEHMDI